MMTEEERPETRGDVLIVEDTMVNLRVVAEILAANGYRVHPVAGGGKALQVAKTTPLDLILLDINLPGRDGFEVCRQLKQLPDVTDVPVIFMSGRGEILDKVRAFEAGGVDYLTKPCHAEELLARVATHVSNRVLQRKLGAAQAELEQALASAKAAEEVASRLLARVLPAAIAARLKETDSPFANHFEEATVLFADLVGFTSYAAAATPDQLIDYLNQIFSNFDVLTRWHGLEKIKTIGDAYMVVGGLPQPRDDHTQAVADLALAMLNVSRVRSHLRLRIGIHRGPVVAGVIGRSRPSYDLWGDTVNIASRVESSGYPDTITVSRDVRDALGGDYIFDSGRVIEVRGRGPLTVFELRGRRGAGDRGPLLPGPGDIE
jgi:class 3 adenylate cyclase